MWDVTDVCDPTNDCGVNWTAMDNNKNDLTPAGASWGDFTYATPTMADPDLALEVACGDDDALVLPYKGYLKRNLQDGVSQVLEILSLDTINPRSKGC